MQRLHVGTSGYNFPEWKGSFYPPKLPSSKWLEYYAQQLGTVEINYTFYRMPSEKTIAGWNAATPEGFTFVVEVVKQDWLSSRCGEPRLAVLLRTYESKL